MSRKTVSCVMVVLLLICMLSVPFKFQPVRADDPGTNTVNAEGSMTPSTSPISTATSLSPGYYDTSEYLIGSVAVGVIFLESNGRIDPDTENWTSADEHSFMTHLDTALDFLASYNPSAHVSFFTESQTAPTSYEPINRPFTDDLLYISEATSSLGYSSLFDYVNDLRNRLHTNWAFAMFVVNALNDADGFFNDDPPRCKDVPNAGGPYAVLAYSRVFEHDMSPIMEHVTCHIFYATDEYNGVKEYGGYLNALDNDGADCIMNHAPPSTHICEATQAQIGWRDTDADGIPDIVDTFPKTTLFPFLPKQSTNGTLTCTGFVTEIPYPNHNRYVYPLNTWYQVPRTPHDITINTIASVEYRVDYGSWANATPTDGALDEAQEDFTFNIPMLPSGTHIVEVRGTNSVGNSETVNMTYELWASTLNRNYGVIVKDTQGNIVPDVDLALKSTDNMVLWNSSTDIQGKADFNLTFTDNNYTDTLTLEAVKQGLFAAKNITFISDTPIILSLSVAVPGDLNGDFKVSLDDLVILAKAYGSKPADPNWNASADIDGNGAVGLSDLVILAQHYGQ